MKYFYFLLSLLVMPSLAQNWEFSGQSPTPEKVEQWQQQAAEQGKDLILVLGANWCGDSAALIQQFNQPEFRKKLKKHYRVELVDVGYFERGYELVESYNEPMYYGTPTVMIVGAESGRIENFNDWQYWTNASKHTTANFEEYFLEKTFKGVSEKGLNESHVKQLQAFKQRQAKRIKAGYDWVAPHLKAYKDSGAKKPPQSFIDKWTAVAKFRNQVHSDIVAAYKDAINEP